MVLEDIIFHIDSTGTNSQYYNHGYENVNYTFRINVLGIYFYNNVIQQNKLIIGY